MISIEFYAEIHLADKLEPNFELGKKETKSKVFLLPCITQ